jgi:hypothetical protein
LREEETLPKLRGSRSRYNSVAMYTRAESLLCGTPVPDLLVTALQTHTEGKEQYLCVVQTTSLSEDF